MTSPVALLDRPERGPALETSAHGPWAPADRVREAPAGEVDCWTVEPVDDVEWPEDDRAGIRVEELIIELL